MAPAIYDDEQYRLALQKLATDQEAARKAQAGASGWERFTSGVGAAGRQSRGFLGQLIGAIIGAFPGPAERAREQVAADVTALDTPMAVEKARLGVLDERARTGANQLRTMLPFLQDRTMSDEQRSANAQAFSGAAPPMTTETTDFSDVPVDETAAEERASGELQKLFPRTAGGGQYRSTRQVPWRGPLQDPIMRSGQGGTEVYDKNTGRFTWIPHPAAAVADRTREGELATAMKFYTDQGESPEQARQHAREEVQGLHFRPETRAGTYDTWEEANAAIKAAHAEKTHAARSNKGKWEVVQKTARRAGDTGEEDDKDSVRNWLHPDRALPPVTPGAGARPGGSGVLGGLMQRMFGGDAGATPSAQRADATTAAVRAGPYDAPSGNEELTTAQAAELRRLIVEENVNEEEALRQVLGQ